jgi:hypothetical protein
MGRHSGEGRPLYLVGQMYLPTQRVSSGWRVARSQQQSYALSVLAQSLNIPSNSFFVGKHNLRHLRLLHRVRQASAIRTIQRDCELSCRLAVAHRLHELGGKRAGRSSRTDRLAMETPATCQQGVAGRALRKQRQATRCSLS